jgi:hypothetical protein
MNARAALALACALASGCKRPPPPLQIVEVKVVDKTPRAQPVPIDLAALTARAKEAIAASSGLPVVASDAACARAHDRCFRLRVEVRGERVEEAAAGKGVLRAIVDAELERDAPGRSVTQRGLAEREYEIAKLGDATDAWRAHLQRAVGDVVSGVGARLKLQSGDARAITQAIEGADEDLRDEAIQIAAERRAADAVPALVKLLKSDDHTLRDAAIGALGQIGDARAVKPLTEAARFRDLVDLPKVLDALALIGGDEARAYLEFVASGHDNEEIRELAKEAIQHLEKRHARDMAVSR